MSASEQRFIEHEIAVWGEDVIYGLLEAGYEPTELIQADGSHKWSWVLRRDQPLQFGSACATVPLGSDRGLLPLRTGRAYRGG